MKRIVTLLILVILCGCSKLSPRNQIDWKEEWQSNELKLKKLINQVKLDNKFYKTGHNKFPTEFSYPFDETFFLVRKDTLIVAIFYLEKDNLDSISTFMYSNDSVKIVEMNGLVEKFNLNEKLDQNWYFINQ